MQLPRKFVYSESLVDMASLVFGCAAFIVVPTCLYNYSFRPNLEKYTPLDLVIFATVCITMEFIMVRFTAKAWIESVTLTEHAIEHTSWLGRQTTLSYADIVSHGQCTGGLLEYVVTGNAKKIRIWKDLIGFEDFVKTLRERSSKESFQESLQSVFGKAEIHLEGHQGIRWLPPRLVYSMLLGAIVFVSFLWIASLR